MTKKEITAILVIVTGLNILAWYLNYKWQLNTDGLTIAAMLIGVISLVFPMVGHYIVWVWYKIAEILGWVNSRILLSIIFFLFLFPISVMYRLFNKDSLAIRKPKRNSIFVERNHQYSAKDFENMW
ncbi:MAG: SxtJ family membrane protein [Bacteroidota bacterium]